MANTRKNLLARIVTPGGDNPLLLNLVAPTVIRTGVAVSGIALVGQGGAGGYAYSLLTGSAYGGLPDGLTLNADGTITGTPTTPGNFSFVAQVQDADSSVYTASFSIRILSRMFRKHKQIRNGEVFVPYTFTLMVAGNTGAVTWSLISGNLPYGLSLDSSTGVISGDPLTDSSGLAGISYFTVRATDAGSGEYVDLPDRILIYDSLEFEPFDIPDIIRGQQYSYTFPIRGGAPPYTFTLIGNPFTVLSKAQMKFNVSTGELSGVTMIPADNYVVGLRVSDRFGAIRTLFDVLVVKNANTTIQTKVDSMDVGAPGPAELDFVAGYGIALEGQTSGDSRSITISDKWQPMLQAILCDVSSFAGPFSTSLGNGDYVDIPRSGTFTGWDIECRPAGSATVTWYRAPGNTDPPEFEEMFTATISNAESASASGLSEAFATGDYMRVTMSGLSDFTYFRLTPRVEH